MNLTAQTQSKHATILHIEGSVDGETYGHLLVEAQQLLTRGVRTLVLELTHCDYMSSAGLMVLTTIFKQMRDLTRSESSASWTTKNTLERAGELGPARQLVLVNPNPSVERVLSLAGMQSFLPIYPNIAQAINDINSKEVVNR
jgi:anti-anti-sigma regulatory factor